MMRVKRFMLLLMAAGLSGFGGSQLLAQATITTAADNGSNYSGGWNSGSSGGLGFGGWTFEASSSSGGSFIGNPSTGRSNLTPLATSSNAFGLWANGGGFSKVTRAFNSALYANDRFTISLGYQWDNGNRGLNLLNGSAEVFNFNVNTSGFTWSGGGSFGSIPWGGTRENGALINLSFTRTSTGFQYEITSPQAPSLNGAGTITAAGLTGFAVYISDAGGGSGADFFFNSPSVTQPVASSMAVPGDHAFLGAWSPDGSNGTGMTRSSNPATPNLWTSYFKSSDARLISIDYAAKVGQVSPYLF